MTIVEGQETYAAFIDIAGFSERVQTDPESLAGVYRFVTRLVRSTPQWKIPVQVIDFKSGEKYDDELGFKTILPPIIFSDSIILVSKNISDRAIQELCTFTNIIFRTLLLRGFPCNGAISKGTGWYYPNDSVYFGTAITKAYELQNQLDCLGIVIDKDINSVNSSKAVPVAFKDGTLEHFSSPHGSSEWSTIPQAVPIPNWQELWMNMKNSAPVDVQSRYDRSIDVLTEMLQDVSFYD